MAVGDAFVGLVDRLVAAVESLRAAERPVSALTFSNVLTEVLLEICHLTRL